MDDILKEIEKAADDIQIPASLDNVKKKLKERKLSEESNYMNYKKSEYKKVNEEKHKNKKFNVRKIVEYAAAIALVIGIGSAGIYNVITRQAGNESEKNIQSDEINASNQVASCEDADKNTRNDADQSQLDSADAYLEKKNDIGTYHLASNYEEVYKLVDTDNIYVSYCGKDKEDASATKKESYSQTNLQVDGVDESDYVKTDGSYIYVQKEDKIVITDVRNEKMNPDLGKNGHIRAMYVDGNQLFLVLQKNASDKMKCILQTYNIADRKHAKLEGSVVVEGEYADSRKVGDFVYLFTNKGILYNETTYKGDKEKIIPLVNDEKIPSGCIYVQNHANSEFIAVSVNVKKPTEIVDQMMVMNASVNVYMGTDAIYLYSTEYKKEKAYTNITKFQYNDGYSYSQWVRDMRSGKKDGRFSATIRGVESTISYRSITSMPGWYVIVELANKDISDITQQFSWLGGTFGCILVAITLIYMLSILLLEKKDKKVYMGLSATDPLTELLNRRALQNAVEEELKKKATGYFIFIDIDNFKTYNDTYGHSNGDLCLKHCARTMKKCFPEDSILVTTFRE